MAKGMIGKPIYTGVDRAKPNQLCDIIATVTAANYADGGVTVHIKTLRGVTYHKDMWDYAELTTLGECEIAEDERTIVNCRVISLYFRPKKP